MTSTAKSSTIKSLSINMQIKACLQRDAEIINLVFYARLLQMQLRRDLSQPKLKGTERKT